MSILWERHIFRIVHRDLLCQAGRRGPAMDSARHAWKSWTSVDSWGMMRLQISPQNLLTLSAFTKFHLFYTNVWAPFCDVPFFYTLDFWVRILHPRLRKTLLVTERWFTLVLVGVTNLRATFIFVRDNQALDVSVTNFSFSFRERMSIIWYFWTPIENNHLLELQTTRYYTSTETHKHEIDLVRSKKWHTYSWVVA